MKRVIVGGLASALLSASYASDRTGYEGHCVHPLTGAEARCYVSLPHKNQSLGTVSVRADFIGEVADKLATVFCANSEAYTPSQITLADCERSKFGAHFVKCDITYIDMGGKADTVCSRLTSLGE